MNAQCVECEQSSFLWRNSSALLIFSIFPRNWMPCHEFSICKAIEVKFTMIKIDWKQLIYSCSIDTNERQFNTFSYQSVITYHVRFLSAKAHAKTKIRARKVISRNAFPNYFTQVGLRISLRAWEWVLVVRAMLTQLKWCHSFIFHGEWRCSNKIQFDLKRKERVVTPSKHFYLFI